MKKLCTLILFLIIAGIAKGQIITTYAGNGIASFNSDNVLATTTGIGYVGFLAINISNDVFLACGSQNRVRKVSQSGLITTIDGNGIAGYSGDNMPAIITQLNSPYGVVIDSLGNVLISDANNNRIRKIDKLTGVITTIAGNGIAGYGGDNILATLSKLNSPTGLTIGIDGDLYIADAGNNRIRKIDKLTGIITTVAGDGVAGYGGDNNLATSAQLYSPNHIAFDIVGNLYIADAANGRVRKVDVNTDIITTIAGNGAIGYNGDNISATTASIDGVADIAFDAVGDLYIADKSNNRIRKVNLLTGIITTAVGNGVAGYSGDNGIATAAQLYFPYSIVFDSCGNLYISDDQNKRIRKVWMSYGIGVYPAAQVCPGTQVTLTAYAPDSCTPVSYQWIKNGVNVGTNNDSFTYVPVNGDVITCQFTCGANGTHTSCNTVHMVVNAAPIAVITVSPNDTVTSGTPVTFTCTVNGGTSITYQWVLNGVNVGTNSNTYTYTPSSRDSVYCIIKATYCGSSNVSDSSNVIHMHILGDGVATIRNDCYRLYPNPINSVLHIDNLKETTSYRILDIVGSTALEGTLQGGSNSISTQLLASGMYLVELINNKGEKEVLRVVKE